MSFNEKTVMGWMGDVEGGFKGNLHKELCRLKNEAEVEKREKIRASWEKPKEESGEIGFGIKRKEKKNIISTIGASRLNINSLKIKSDIKISQINKDCTLNLNVNRMRNQKKTVKEERKKSVEVIQERNIVKKKKKCNLNSIMSKNKPVFSWEMKNGEDGIFHWLHYYKDLHQQYLFEPLQSAHNDKNKKDSFSHPPKLFLQNLHLLHNEKKKRSNIQVLSDTNGKGMVDSRSEATFSKTHQKRPQKKNFIEKNIQSVCTNLSRPFPSLKNSMHESRKVANLKKKELTTHNRANLKESPSTTDINVDQFNRLSDTISSKTCVSQKPDVESTLSYFNVPLRLNKNSVPPPPRKTMCSSPHHNESPLQEPMPQQLQHQLSLINLPKNHEHAQTQVLEPLHNQLVSTPLSPLPTFLSCPQPLAPLVFLSSPQTLKTENHTLIKTKSRLSKDSQVDLSQQVAKSPQTLSSTNQKCYVMKNDEQFSFTQLEAQLQQHRLRVQQLQPLTQQHSLPVQQLQPHTQQHPINSCQHQTNTPQHLLPTQEHQPHTQLQHLLHIQPLTQQNLQPTQQHKPQIQQQHLLHTQQHQPLTQQHLLPTQQIQPHTQIHQPHTQIHQPHLKYTNNTSNTPTTHSTTSIPNSTKLTLQF